MLWGSSERTIHTGNRHSAFTGGRPVREQPRGRTPEPKTGLVELDRLDLDGRFVRRGNMDSQEMRPAFDGEFERDILPFAGTREGIVHDLTVFGGFGDGFLGFFLVIQQFAAGYLDGNWGLNGTANVLPFIVLLIILLFKPHGLFGTHEIERV